MRTAHVPLAVAVLLLLSACSGSSPHAAPHQTLTTAAPPTSTATTAAPSRSATTPPVTPSTSRASARNLPVTDAVRQQLLARAAAAVSLPPSDFAGLAHGNTYFALDTTTDTYWAAAALIPLPGSTPAQVAVQDAGAYDLFSLHGPDPAHGAWKVYLVGQAGPTGSGCHVHPPTAVNALWGWDKGSCRPELLRP